MQDDNALDIANNSEIEARFPSALPLGTALEQIAIMRVLVDQFHSNMEGCDYYEFLYWENLMLAADLIAREMERHNPTACRERAKLNGELEI